MRLSFRFGPQFVSQRAGFVLRMVNLFNQEMVGIQYQLLLIMWLLRTGSCIRGGGGERQRVRGRGTQHLRLEIDRQLPIQVGDPNGGKLLLDGRRVHDAGVALGWYDGWMQRFRGKNVRETRKSTRPVSSRS